MDSCGFVEFSGWSGGNLSKSKGSAKNYHEIVQIHFVWSKGTQMKIFYKLVLMLQLLWQNWRDDSSESQRSSKNNDEIIKIHFGWWCGTGAKILYDLAFLCDLVKFCGRIGDYLSESQRSAKNNDEIVEIHFLESDLKSAKVRETGYS